jgi:hypothetical protein
LVLFYAGGVEEMMVGAGVGRGFVKTNELHTVKYDDAMSSKDRSSWIKAVEEEYVNMLDHGVLSRSNCGRILSTTWMMRK